MAALAEDDLTVAQAAELLGMHRNTVEYHLKRAADEKRAHICGWDRKVGVQGDWGAIYRNGEGANVPQPKTQGKATQRMYSRRYYKANRAVIRARSAAKRGRLGHYVQLLA
jgi:DNA-binding transcriptional ArsR family regulator